MKTLNLGIVLWLELAAIVVGQTPLPARIVVRLGPIDTVTAKAGGMAKIALSVQVDQGFHVPRSASVIDAPMLDILPVSSAVRIAFDDILRRVSGGGAPMRLPALWQVAQRD